MTQLSNLRVFSAALEVWTPFVLSQSLVLLRLDSIVFSGMTSPVLPTTVDCLHSVGDSICNDTITDNLINLVSIATNTAGLYFLWFCRSTSAPVTATTVLIMLVTYQNTVDTRTLYDSKKILNQMAQAFPEDSTK